MGDSNSTSRSTTPPIVPTFADFFVRSDEIFLEISIALSSHLSLKWIIRSPVERVCCLNKGRVIGFCDDCRAAIKEGGQNHERAKSL
jgi:hypothetical protein